MKGNGKFFTIVIALLLGSTLVLTGCMYAISENNGQMKPYDLNGPKENNDGSGGNIVEDVPLPQQSLQAKFEAMYEISEDGKTITVISEDYLHNYWHSNYEKEVIHSLTTEEVYFIIQDSIRIYEQYDKVVLTGFASYSSTMQVAERFPFVAEQEIRIFSEISHLDRGKVISDIHAIILYRLKALSSPKAFFTGAEAIRFAGFDPAVYSSMYPETLFYIPGYSASTDRNDILSMMGDPASPTDFESFPNVFAVSDGGGYRISFFPKGCGSSTNVFPTDEMNNVLIPDGFETNPEQTPEPPKEPLFQYDPHKITPDGRSYLTDHEYALYCNMIDSILDHNGVVEGFASYDEFFKIWAVLHGEFIPAGGMVQNYSHSEEPFLYENGTATLRFVRDKETCDRYYGAFEDIINEALSLIQEDDSDWERIAKLYLYVSDHMTYGGPYETFGADANLYNCILYQLGTCSEYAYYLNLLANQIGLETIVGRSLGIEGLADHAWSMIRVEGQWYHFDACWEASLSHENMTYFAFKAQDRHNTLANDNPWGITGEIDMFSRNDYTNERSELPYCESGMGAEERRKLYDSVIDEYTQGISKDITTDIEEYIDAAYNDILGTAAGGNVGICFELKPDAGNSTVRGLILTYSPEDLVNYPLLEDGSVHCKYHSIVLTHIDQTDPKAIMFFILHEGVVIQQSVKFVVV